MYILAQKTSCMVKKIGILLFFALLVNLGFSQKNRYPAFFSEINKLSDNELIYEKLISFKKEKKLNQTELFLYYSRLIQAAIQIQKYDVALENAKNALKMAETANNLSLQAEFGERLGVCYYYINQKEQAESCFMKALPAAKKSGSWEIESKICRNLGALYIEDKNLKTAENYLLQSLTILKKNKAHFHLSILPNRLLATLYTTTEDFDKAASTFKENIYLSKKVKDTNLICSSLIFYSDLCLKLGKKKESVSLAREAVELQRKTNNKNSLGYMLTQLAKSLAESNQEKEAILLYRQIIAINKDIFQENIEKGIAEVEVKFKTAEIKRQKELAESKALAEKSKNSLYLTLFIGILFFLTVIFFIFYLRQSNKRKKLEIDMQKKHLKEILEAQEEEKKRIARDLHDGICQKFAATKMKFSYISEALLDNSPDLKANYNSCIDLLDEATKELRSVAHEIMPPVLKEMGLVEAIKQLSYQTFYKHLAYSIEVFGTIERSSETQELNFYRVTQELFANVIKHADATQVFVQLMFSNNKITLMVEDNGKGFETSNKTGMGLGNIQVRADMMQAKFNIEPSPEGGTLATFTANINIENN